ncbi:MAG: hypothetical protein MJ200_01000 [Mycoplasmoidaceae bacterium]|nr:hypothetical protein [Mycoplasmoidaceae bacterium]
MTNGIYDFKNIETFNRYNEDGELSAFYNNYTDTIGIIAQLLSISNITVNKDMSL